MPQHKSRDKASLAQFADALLIDMLMFIAPYNRIVNIGMASILPSEVRYGIRAYGTSQSRLLNAVSRRHSEAIARLFAPVTDIGPRDAYSYL